MLSNDLKNAGKMGITYLYVVMGVVRNAMHIANDFHYGVGCADKYKGNKEKIKPGLRMLALPSNPSIITYLANDIGYDNIYSHQLKSWVKRTIF